MTSADLWGSFIESVTLKHPGHTDQKVHGNWARTGFSDDPQHEIEYYSPEDKDKCVAIMQKLTGKPFNAKDFGLIVGAPDHAKISVEEMNDEVWISVQHKYITDMQRRIGRGANGKATVFTDLFIADEDAPHGFGTRSFANLVTAARHAGLEQVETHAVGSPGEFWNGYYTWPRMGYNAPLEQSDRKKIMRDIIAGKLPSMDVPADLHGLMARPAGRLWWKLNGHEINGVFDLAQSSVSSKILDAYAKRRGITPRRLT